MPSIESVARKTILIWVLAMLVATSQGGIQALSRSFYGKPIPPKKSAEFFGFYNVLGKFAAVMGPAPVAFFSSLTRSSAAGVLSINILFVVGGLLLGRCREGEPGEAAESERLENFYLSLDMPSFMFYIISVLV